MSKSVLIITNSFDTHADVISEKLITRERTPYFRINLDCFPRDYVFESSLAGDVGLGSITHRTSGASVQLNNIVSIWLRKPADYAFSTPNLLAQEQAFAVKEVDQILLGLTRCVRCFWLSHPSAIREATWKIEQLSRARQNGFTIPSTIVTNDPNKARAFWQRHIATGIIYKPLSSSDLAAGALPESERTSYGLGTTVVTRDLLDQHVDSISVVPGLFQELVDKDYELRVTLVGRKVFAARIESQVDKRTSVDWRDMSIEIPFTNVDLPSTVKERCLALMESYGLSFGAIDLAFSKNGQIIFFEINPVGQFLFLDELIPSLDISGSVAHLLAVGGRT